VYTWEVGKFAALYNMVSLYLLGAVRCK